MTALRMDTLLVLAQQATGQRATAAAWPECARCVEPFTVDSLAYERSKKLCDECAHAAAEQLGEGIIEAAELLERRLETIAHDGEQIVDWKAAHSGLCAEVMQLKSERDGLAAELKKEQEDSELLASKSFDDFIVYKRRRNAQFAAYEMLAQAHKDLITSTDAEIKELTDRLAIQAPKSAPRLEGRDRG